MRYLALATDYDDTLATEGVVDKATLGALRRLRDSGRKTILVTGREVADLERTFPYLSLFDLMVGENGALLFNPATQEKRLLAARLPDRFLRDLQARNVTEVSVGDVIVSTMRGNEAAVVESIRELGLKLEIIFNKRSLMILPAGVDKMTGLQHALSELKLSAQNVVGVGDAENDLAFLAGCGFSVAVANAIPMLKERVDLVTQGARGVGVAELIDQLIGGDLLPGRLVL